MKSVLALVLLLAFIVAGNIYLRSKSQAEVEISAKNCELNHSACNVILDDGASISFSIDPKPIKANRALNLNLKSQNITINSAAVEITGVNMEMGLLTYELHKKDDQTFSGGAALGICTLSKMLWLAKVKIKSDKGIYTVNFPFATYRKNINLQ